MGTFSETVRRTVFARQKGACAVCGRLLNALMEDTGMRQVEYHHLVKASYGGADTAENCVALCTNTTRGAGDGCHYRVHQNGLYRGVAAPPTYFPQSHGGNVTDHRLWARKLLAENAALWG